MKAAVGIGYGLSVMASSTADVLAGKQITSARHAVSETGVKMLAHNGSRQKSCALEVKTDATAKPAAEIHCHNRQTAATPRNTRISKFLLSSRLTWSPGQP